MKTKYIVPLAIDEKTYELLEVLTGEFNPTVESVIQNLIEHARQGIYRPGAWEREWLCQAFADDWIDNLEPGDPYGRSPDSMFQRPKSGRAKGEGSAHGPE
jgi:hypothetical protein